MTHGELMAFKSDCRPNRATQSCGAYPVTANAS